MAIATAVMTDDDELPPGWRWRSLASLTADFFSGKRPRGGVSGLTEGPLSLGGEHVAWDGTINLKTPRHIPLAFAEAMTDAELAVDDILIVKDGATTGKTAFVRSLPERAFVNEHVFVVRPNDEALPKYLFYWLWSRPGFEQLMLDFRGSAQGGIGRTFVDRVSVPWAPLETQREVVARIDEMFAELDDGETVLVRAQGELETYRKSLLKAAVTGELTADWRAANPPKESAAELLQHILADRRSRWKAEPRNRGKQYKEPLPLEASELPEIPEGWTWASLQQVAFVSGGLTVDSKRKPANPKEVPYLRVANVQRGGLDLTLVKTITVSPDELDRLQLKSGDILLNEGGDRDKIGRGWVWQGELPVCVHQNHVFKARPASPIIVPKLVSMYFNELGRKFFIDQGKQTTNLASISLTKVSRAPVAIPPADEGAVILERLVEMERNAADPHLVSEIHSASNTLRQSILAAAFRGELVQ